MIYDSNFVNYQPAMQTFAPTHHHQQQQQEQMFYQKQQQQLEHSYAQYVDEPSRSPHSVEVAVQEPVKLSAKGRPVTVNDPLGVEKYLPKREKCAFTVAELKEHDNRVRNLKESHAAFVQQQARMGVYVNPDFESFTREREVQQMEFQRSLLPVDPTAAANNRPLAPANARTQQQQQQQQRPAGGAQTAKPAPKKGNFIENIISKIPGGKPKQSAAPVVAKNAPAPINQQQQQYYPSAQQYSAMPSPNYYGAPSPVMSSPYGYSPQTMGYPSEPYFAGAAPSYFPSSAPVVGYGAGYPQAQQQTRTW